MSHLGKIVVTSSGVISRNKCSRYGGDERNATDTDRHHTETRGLMEQASIEQRTHVYGKRRWSWSAKRLPKKEPGREGMKGGEGVLERRQTRAWTLLSEYNVNRTRKM